MKRVGLLLVLASLAGASTARAVIPSLYVNYNGDNCTFQVTTDAGTPLTTIPPGTYQVVVSTHDPYGLTGSCKGFVQFRLTGPGVSLFTTLDYGDGSSEIDSESFQAGATYAMQDDGNIAATHMMFTIATTGSAAGVTTTTSSSSKGASTPSVVPTRGALQGLVSASGAVSLTTKAGKPVTSLKAGRYTFSVHDQSKTRGFSLQALGHAAKALTTAGYTGWRDTTVTLTAGRWFAFAKAGAKKTFFVTG